MPIPASLTANCDIPHIPEHMTYLDSVELNFTLLQALDECSGQVIGIRKAESAVDKIQNNKGI